MTATVANDVTKNLFAIEEGDQDTQRVRDSVESRQCIFASAVSARSSTVDERAYHRQLASMKVGEQPDPNSSSSGGGTRSATAARSACLL